MSHRLRAAAVTTIVCCLTSVSGAAAPLARAATGSNAPAVDIVPAGTTTHDPNQGLWFVMRMTADTTARGAAMLVNPADVAQTVTLFARELDFTDSGTPVVSPDPGAGIGGWVTFDRQTVMVPAQGRVEVGYTVRAPKDAEPGDHTGVLVAQSSPEAINAHLQLFKRIATRFYVTVPGKAVVSYDVRALNTHADDPLFPGQERVQVSVANTGNIRFVPGVEVNGRPASGSDLVLSRSVEVYRGTVHVPWYGGPVRVRVTTTADGALPRTLTKTIWVIPWGLLAIALVVIAVVVHAWVYGRRRWRRYLAGQTALRAELAELQRLAAEKSATSGRP